MTTYATARQILSELDGILSRVDQAQVDQLRDTILGSRRIVAYAMGREGLVLRGFIMRLMHMGLDVAMVGDMTTPPIGAGDLFLVVCGPGYVSTTEALMGVAHAAGARIAMVTAQPQALLPQRADVLVHLPAQTMAEAENSSSGQAMGSAFEQGVWLLFDALIPQLQADRGQTADDLRGRHTNME